MTMMPTAPSPSDTEPVNDLGLDYLHLDGLFSAEELALRDRVRAFVDERIRPNIASWYATATFPRHLVKEMGSLGLLGMHLRGYGCPGRSAIEYGLAAMELEAGDSGIRTFVSVQGSLAMSAIWKFGSEEHKQRWLPGMAAGDLIGCFGLTEPTAGSDPASMTTAAVRDGDDWVLTVLSAGSGWRRSRTSRSSGRRPTRGSGASSSRLPPRASPPP
jgi:glutaryl-CoA dehydrogenase